ncbi:MAG: Cof-type HAD-IIB family hydrolase [Bacilli bacterium]
MKKYKIVFIDIDGTLRNSDGIIDKETINQIKRLKDQGYLVVLCTGRSCKYAKNVALEVGTSDYLISSNGAEVTNIKTNEVIFNAAIPEKDVKEILSYCQKSNINMLLNTTNEDYQSIEESSNRILINSYDEIKYPVNQIVLTSLNYNRMLVIPRMFADLYPSIHLASTSNDLKSGNRHPNKDYFHDFNAVGVSKARGITELLDYLHISKEDAITIGDGDNDISMCELAGYCVAMGNATSKLKSIADEITKTNDEKGVSYFTNKLLS